MNTYDWLTDVFYTDSTIKKDLVDGKAKTLLARVDYMMHKGVADKLDKIKEYAEHLNLEFNDKIKPEHEIEELAQECKKPDWVVEKKDLSEVKKKLEKEFTKELEKAFSIKDKKERSDLISEITEKAKKILRDLGYIK